MIRDALGQTFEAATPPRRVVSLVPSVTETLFELGAGESLTGVTTFCTFPVTIDRPRVGGTKNPDVEAIRTLRPDLVHLNLEENLRRHADAIRAFAPVFVSHPRSVADAAALIEALGEIHGRQEQASRLASQIRSESERAASEFTFVCPIWKDPWMWCGGDTYVSNLIETAGGRNLLRAHDRYPTLPLDAVLDLEPAVIVLPDEPFVFTESDAAELRDRSGARVLGPFPGHLVTWHGARTLQGLRFLHTAFERG